MIGFIEGALQDWQRPELLLHYGRYAQASYGSWSKPTSVRRDVCSLCNFATLTAMAPRDLGRVLSASNENEIALSPYAIVFDELYKSVVITIRGSASISDAVTDALAEPSLIWRKLSELQKKKLREDSIWKTFKGNPTRLVRWYTDAHLFFAQNHD